MKLNDDGTLTLEGVASTTNKDLQQEIVSSKAIDSMVKQAVALNLHGDHNYDLFAGVIGSIVSAEKTENNELYIKAVILGDYAAKIKNMLDIGINLGFSIGGIPVLKGNTVKDIKLLEVSLTALPANWDTFGTVKASDNIIQSNCIGKACYKIQKELDKNNVENPQLEGNGGENMTQEEVKNLFNNMMAEKEKTIVEELSEKIKPQIEEIAQDVVERAKKLDAENNPPKPPEEKEKEEEENENVLTNTELEKSLSDLGTKLQEGMVKAFESDEFMDKLSEKMFGKMGENRKPESTVEGNLEEKEGGESTIKSYTSDEIADMFIQKQNSSNPLFRKLNK